MELKLRQNWQDFVTAKQIERHNKIVERANTTGKLTTSNGMFLVDYDKRTRVCNTCGRTFKESGGWVTATFENSNGEEIPCGLMADCFECQLKDIYLRGLRGEFNVRQEDNS